MNDQRTLAMAAGFEKHQKRTRRAEFLSQMEIVVPWRELVAAIEPFYPRIGNGRPPVGLERMLRMYFLQQWFNLSDPAVEEALYDSMAMRHFAGIDLGQEPVPDETTMCKFRHLLERHGLGKKIFQRVNGYLESRGVTIGTGTIVDATLIEAPSSTKNKPKNKHKQRDPEMHQTRKGKQWHFGMKAHVGVDAETRLVHSVAVTAANVADCKMLPELLHGSITGERVTSWHPLPQYVHALIAATPDSVLLQTARFDAANRSSYLYLHPLRILNANRLEDIPQLFADLETALADGHHAAGYLDYECGYHFEPRTKADAFAAPTQRPLAWFGIYAGPITFDHVTGRFSEALSVPTCDVPAGDVPAGDVPPGDVPAGGVPFADSVRLNIDQADYTNHIHRIQELISAGDTYQVNFTDSVTLDTPLSAREAFSTLIRRQPVAYAAFLNVAGQQILSLSPELFFHLDGDAILTRPMKGTIARGLDLAEDAVAALALQNDEKNRSEHVMIVDLLRNDLGRICTLGSVHVPDLFTVERYETLHQMTSTVAGTLRGRSSYYDIFRALFPSGSITGAPKIRTMQIIRDLEAQPRGIYTGAIGHIAPAVAGQPRRASFNVAIRTLTLQDAHARMGVGGGIVADSEPAAEYRECLLKSSFLTRPANDFQLIETIRWSASQTQDTGFYLLSLHLDRLAASADYFNFPNDRAAIRQQLVALTSRLTEAQQYRIRLLLYPDGRITLTPARFTAAQRTGRIRLAAERTLSTDLFLRHKTTRRHLYDQGYRDAVAAGYEEVLYRNERDELTEGTISNLFLRIGGELLTPPLACGVLPGIYRRHLLDTDPNAKEKVLSLEDLYRADAIYICNSIRGMNEVTVR